MKQLPLLTAALLGLGVVSQASADPVVYLTGSTAFRSLAYLAIHNGHVIGAPDYELTMGNATASKCNYMLFHGTLSSTPVFLDCAWSGSDAGAATVLNLTIHNDSPTVNLAGSPETWLQANESIAAGNYSANPTTAQLESSSHQGDLAFVDTSIQGTLEQIQQQAGLTPPADYGKIGVVTFSWAKNNNNASGASAAKTAWINLTNITTYQEQALFGAGALPADYFTGVAADNTAANVYLVGRNQGSGTRANVLLDCGLTPDTPIIQFNVGGYLNTTFAGVLSLDINGGGVNPDDGVDQNDGYESGGNVSKSLGVAGSTSQGDPFSANAGWIAIGYLGCNDAAGIGGQTDPTSNWLTENGVKESSATITTGQYSYWGYEHLYGKPGNSGIQNTMGTALAAGAKVQIGTDGSGGATEHTIDINLTDMNASKLLDSSYPTHN